MQNKSIDWLNAKETKIIHGKFVMEVMSIMIHTKMSVVLIWDILDYISTYNYVRK